MSLIYIYIGASASKLVTLFTDKDSSLHTYEFYMLIAGTIILGIVIYLVTKIARKELAKYVDEGSVP